MARLFQFDDADPLHGVAPSVSQGTEWGKYLLLDCLDSYLTLSQAETVQYETMLTTAPYQAKSTVIQTLFDKARAEGREEGHEEGMRRVCLEQLRKRFQLAPEVVAPRLQRLSSAELADLPLRILDADSFKSLDLGG